MVTALTQQDDALGQGTVQRLEAMLEDDQDRNNEGWGPSLGGASIVFLGGKVAGQQVRGGGTRSWSNGGMSEDQERMAEQAEADEDGVAWDQDGDEMADQQASAELFDMLSRAAASASSSSSQSSRSNWQVYRFSGLDDEVQDEGDDFHVTRYYPMTPSSSSVIGSTFEALFDLLYGGAQNAESSDESHMHKGKPCNHQRQQQKARRTEIHIAGGPHSAPSAQVFYSSDDDVFADGDDLLMYDEDDVNAAASVDAGLWQRSSSRRPRAGLDVDFDGEPDLSLDLFDPETGDLNWELLTLTALLFVSVAVFLNLARSWLQLRSVMHTCGGAGGHLLVPIVVRRNGRVVRGHMLLPREEADGSDMEEGEYECTYCPPPDATDEDPKAALKQQQVGKPAPLLPDVVVASDFEDDKSGKPL